MGLFSKKRRQKRADETTLFFATDLHGSEVCFRKFVNAASFYEADALVLGGDVTGKLVVPIVGGEGGPYRARLHGQPVEVGRDGLPAFERQVHDMGFYTERMSEAEYRHYRDSPAAVEQLFEQVMHRTLIRWMEYAREKLAGTGVRIFTAPGNDDPYSIDEVIREHGGEDFLLLEGDIVEVAPGMEMLNTGYTNKTPWDTHREYSEEEIAEHLEKMAAGLRDPETALFNIHVPPYDSKLDTAPLLGQDLGVKTSVGGPQTAPVGSTAVREAIEKYQPLLTLHGHIHESAGTVRIGRSTVINAGSEYTQGVLRGTLVTVGHGEIVRHQATSG
jgi:uncharacterized protein